MPKTPEELLAYLSDLGIAATTHRHPPVFTVEESQAMRGDLPGGHCKNLFLKDKKQQVFLVVSLEDHDLDLKSVAKAIGAKSPSFGKPELLMELLGVEPGSVTPFGAINDTEGRVQVVLEADMMARDLLNYHPLCNDATTAITPDDLLAFLRATGHEPLVIAL